MILNYIDWSIIIVYFIFSLIIGLYFSKRASKSINEYFLSGRSIPWWLAGTSMVATTFAADTPLAVTGMVSKHGVAGNWLWWNFAMSGILTVFFFAPLWRRAGVMTDVEFAEIRYSGKPASFLRAFRALYLAIPINCIIMGWVTLGMAKVMELTLGIKKWEAVFICFGVTVIYSIISGLWGVLVTDFFQFIIAMGGSIVLAVFSLKAVGGIEGIVKHSEALPVRGSPLSFIPDVGSAWMPLITFFVYVGMIWWSSWYPGAEPGGGGYVAQRIFSTKNETHSILATFWFNIAHYALRPWPWILVALSSMIVFPNLSDPETGYVRMIKDYLPNPFRGLILAGFAAAYMSTIATHLNWGASYVVNDFYKRFIKKSESEKHYVFISRAATIFIMLLSGVVTYFMGSIEHAWKLLISIGAGAGLVLLLRWYWWRINAWSEISAMAASLIISLILQVGFKLDSNNPIDFAKIMLITVSGSILMWLSVTYLTKPEPEQKLIEFYNKVRPGKLFWKPVAENFMEMESKNNLLINLFCWVLGSISIYLSLFGIGKLIFGSYLKGIIYLALSLTSIFIILFQIKRNKLRLTN
ncbi:MAG: sodium:solute symporter family protein [Acidobacteriota bacterium]